MQPAQNTLQVLFAFTWVKTAPDGWQLVQSVLPPLMLSLTCCGDEQRCASLPDAALCMCAAEEIEEEDMAHPIQRARLALRNAEVQTEQADGNQTEDDIEAGHGERPQSLKSFTSSAPYLRR